MPKEAFPSMAAHFAREKHKDQLDDNGLSYFHTHINIMGNAIGYITDDPEIIAATYLHDTIEDTDTTYDELVRVFNKRIADLVMEVTQEGQKDEYGYYFPRLKSKEAILIKLIDRASNVSRMSSWDKKRQEQYLKRTKFWKDGSDLNR